MNPFLTLEDGTGRLSETSARNYYPEERSSHLLHVGILKPGVILLPYKWCVHSFFNAKVRRVYSRLRQDPAQGITDH